MKTFPHVQDGAARTGSSGELLLSRLEWLRGWALQRAADDADDQCRAIAAGGLSPQAPPIGERRRHLHTPHRMPRPSEEPGRPGARGSGQRTDRCDFREETDPAAVV